MEYGIGILFILSASYVVIGMWYAVSVIYHNFKRMFLIEKVGQKSLLIMMIHLKVLKIIQCVMSKCGITDNVHWLIVFGLDFAITYLVSFVCMQHFSILYKLPKKEQRENDD
jgi:fucose 4-O-acetylase-like acetyltransferase